MSKAGPVAATATQLCPEPSPTSQLSRILVAPGIDRPPVFLWPLSPPSAAVPGPQPTPSASQMLSLQVCALGSTFSWHAAKQCFHLGSLSCSVFSLHVVQSCVLSPFL